MEVLRFYGYRGPVLTGRYCSEVVAPPLSRGPLPRITCGTRAWAPSQVIHPGARPPTVGYSLRSLRRACNLITPGGHRTLISTRVVCKPTKSIVVGRAGGWLVASAPTRRPRPRVGTGVVAHCIRCRLVMIALFTIHFPRDISRSACFLEIDL